MLRVEEADWLEGYWSNRGEVRTAEWKGLEAVLSYVIRTDSSRLWGARDCLEGNGDEIKLKFRKIISSVYDDVGEGDPTTIYCGWK